ncbi:MAG: class B sortase [Eubacterium sp.]
MKNKICIVMILVLTAIFAVSTYFLVTESVQDKEQMDKFESIAQAVEDSGQCSDNKYADLYAQNNDFIGWIKIEDTVIDYPVMQSKNIPNFYLNHNFNKEYSRFGVPYIQENCSLSSDNIIVYGHNMKNKSMFNELTKYKSKDFYNAHRNIQFDTLTEQRTYAVVCAFKTVVYTSNGFDYYSFVNANTEEDFSVYIEKCKALSFYDTGVNTEYGDKLITLSTCEYSQNNGRFVVVAKQVGVTAYET